MMNLADAAWRTSTYSGSHDNCVEVGPTSKVVGIRDTKNRDGGALTVSYGMWNSFVATVKTR